MVVPVGVLQGFSYCVNLVAKGCVNLGGQGCVTLGLKAGRRWGSRAGPGRR